MGTCVHALKHSFPFPPSSVGIKYTAGKAKQGVPKGHAARKHTKVGLVKFHITIKVFYVVFWLTGRGGGCHIYHVALGKGERIHRLRGKF